MTTTTTSICMVTYDHMPGFLLAYSHPPGDSMPTIVAVTLVMIGLNPPVSHPTQALPVSLQ